MADEERPEPAPELAVIERQLEERAQVLEYVNGLKRELEAQRYDDAPVRVIIGIVVAIALAPLWIAAAARESRC